MAINNLSSLQLAIADWVARTDIDTGTINNFIDAAEAEIINGVYDPSGRAILPPLKCFKMEVQNTTFPLSGEYTQLPSGFLGAKTVKLNGTFAAPLDFVPMQVFEATYLSTANSASPKAYTFNAAQLRVGPNASSSDTLNFTYYAFTDNLTTVSGGQNWISLNYPMVYMYGALRHLATYTGMDQRLALFQGAFISQLAALHAKEKSIEFSGTALAGRPLGVTTT